MISQKTKAQLRNLGLARIVAKEEPQQIISCYEGRFLLQERPSSSYEISDIIDT